MMEAAIEAGADDVESDADGHTITCTFEALSEVAGALAARLGDAEAANVVWRPHATIEVTGDPANTLRKLLDILEDDDDVQNVFANHEMDEAG
jgi:transcriptional/translational regulatory protein YebC/TACO1